MTPSFLSPFFPWLNLHTSNRDVIVDASRGTRLTSHFHFSGDPRIEEEVIEKVASYGKQLGILSEAVLALAGEEGEKTEKVTQLKEMKHKIDDIKKKYPDGLEQETHTLLARLKQKDPAAYKRLLNEHHERQGRE